MHRKIPLLLLLFCCSFFYFCTDSIEMSERTMTGTDDSPLMRRAKSILNSSENMVSVPDFKRKNVVKARNLGYSTDAVPLWNEAVQLDGDSDEEILLVPLQEECIRYSHTKIRRGNEESRQFAASFSRLLVRTKGTKTIAHVLTYLPERKYARENQTALDSMKYHPGKAGYEGLILISSLNGTFKHGFLYENGRAVIRLSYGHERTDSCSHQSHTHSDETHEKIQFHINFYTQSLQSRGYTTQEEEELVCSTCWKPVDECTCFPIEGEYIYCDNCGEKSYECVCDAYRCSFCGKYPCVCGDVPDLCPVCWEYPCICYEEEECAICGNLPCICGTDYCSICGKEKDKCECCPLCNKYPCECKPEEPEEADPCATKQLLNENDGLNSKVSDLLDLIHNGYIATEEGWIKTSNNTYYSPSKKTATSLSYDWSGITEKNITEWYHSHPSGSPYPSFADLEMLCKKANEGYVVDYENFTYGIISCTGCISFIITSPSIFKTFCSNMSSSAKSNIETAYTNLIMNTNQTMSMEDRLFYLLDFLNVQNSGLSILYREYGLDWEQWEGIEMGTDTVQNIECN